MTERLTEAELDGLAAAGAAWIGEESFARLIAMARSLTASPTGGRESLVEAIIRELAHIHVGMVDQYQAATILERLVGKAQAALSTEPTPDGQLQRPDVKSMVTQAFLNRYEPTPDAGRELLGAAKALNAQASQVYADNVAMGWYTDPATGLRKDRNVGELLALIHSEISEGLEGHRKSLMDDHLPNRPMLEVEMADAVIRIFDLCGYLGLDIGGAYVEKRAYNATRADHKMEARLAPGGKSI